MAKVRTSLPLHTTEYNKPKAKRKVKRAVSATKRAEDARDKAKRRTQQKPTTKNFNRIAKKHDKAVAKHKKELKVKRKYN